MGTAAIADASRKSQQAGGQGRKETQLKSSEHDRRGKDDRRKEGGCDMKEDSGEKGSPRNDLKERE